MKFIKNLFTKKENKEEKELDVKPFIDDFIASGVLSSLKSKKVVENAEVILNTIFESNVNQNMGQMEIMGLFFKIRKKIGLSKDAFGDIAKLFNLFFKFMEKKGLVTDEIKKEMDKIGVENIDIPQTVRRETPKIGRNEPCPCQSGKKYKTCCGR